MRTGSRMVVADVCAWPNLIKISEHCLGAVIFNKPSHGLEEGSLELWAADARTLQWSYLSTPCPGPQDQNRMHSACGVRKDGTIDVLSTGFSVANGRFLGLEPLWHSCSTDGGHTWVINKDIPIRGVDAPCIPHGAIISDGTSLFATVYRSFGKGNPSYTWFIRSGDNGRTWSLHSQIGVGDTNEAHVINNDSVVLAAVRTHIDHHTRLYSLPAGAEEWQDNGPLTLPMQHPGHLLVIGKESLLLTYGIRNRGLMAIGGRLSTDLGKSWRAPFVLEQFPQTATDCGYPSTLVLDKDTLVTGYYTNHSKDYHGYQFGVVTWKLSDILSAQELESISDGAKMRL